MCIRDRAKVELYATLSTLPIAPNKTAKIIKTIKQQISKFYPQILSTEDSFYINDRPLTEINVIASSRGLNLRKKLKYLLFKNRGFYNEEKLKPVFVFIIVVINEQFACTHSYLNG